MKPANILTMSLRESSRPVLSKLLPAQYSHASQRGNSPKVSLPTVQLTTILFYAKRSEVACLINVFEYPQNHDRPRQRSRKRERQKKARREENSERERNGES